VSWNN